MKPNQSRLMWSIVTIAVGVTITSGCVTGRLLPPPDNGELIKPDRAILVSDNVEITVEDPDGAMPSRIVAAKVFAPGRHLPSLPKAEQIGKSSSYEGYYSPEQEYGYIGALMQVDLRTTGKYSPYIVHVVPDSPVDRAGWNRTGGFLREARWEHPNRERIGPGEDFTYVVCPSRASMNAGGEACQTGTVTAAPRPNPYRVRVHVEGRDKPLYGLLAFFPVPTTAKGSASRIHRIEVPQRYIDRARAGNVSVVYQPYGYPFTSMKDGISPNMETKTRRQVSWALWMSDIPFY